MSFRWCRLKHICLHEVQWTLGSWAVFLYEWWRFNVFQARLRNGFRIIGYWFQESSEILSKNSFREFKFFKRISSQQKIILNWILFSWKLKFFLKKWFSSNLYRKRSLWIKVFENSFSQRLTDFSTEFFFLYLSKYS